MKKTIKTSFGELEYETSFIDKIIDHVLTPLLIWSGLIIVVITFPLLWVWFLRHDGKYKGEDDSYRNEWH